MPLHVQYLVLGLLALAAFAVAVINPKPVKEYQLSVVSLGLFLVTAAFAVAWYHG